MYRIWVSYSLVVEEFNSTKVVFDPFSEDGVFLSSVGQFTAHTSADISIESERKFRKKSIKSTLLCRITVRFADKWIRKKKQRILDNV